MSKDPAEGMCTGFRNKQMYDETVLPRWTDNLSVFVHSNNQQVADAVLEKEYVLPPNDNETLKLI